MLQAQTVKPIAVPSKKFSGLANRFEHYHVLTYTTSFVFSDFAGWLDYPVVEDKKQCHFDSRWVVPFEEVQAPNEIAYGIAPQSKNTVSGYQKRMTPNGCQLLPRVHNPPSKRRLSEARTSIFTLVWRYPKSQCCEHAGHGVSSSVGESIIRDRKPRLMHFCVPRFVRSRNIRLIRCSTGRRYSSALLSAFNWQLSSREFF